MPEKNDEEQKLNRLVRRERAREFKRVLLRVEIIIGIIVNITLIRMAITSKSYIPLVIGCALPSLSALPLGLVGTIQLSFVYTCYMMPFI